MGLGLLGLVVLLTVLVPRAPSAHRALRPLRSLFPSWRFFDAIEDTNVMYAREVPEHGAPGPWLPLVPPPRRSGLSLLYNPRGNLLLACHAVVDQLVDELEEAGELTAEQVEALVSYHLLGGIVRAVGPAWPRYQLRLVSCAIGARGVVTEEELFVSRVHEA